MTELLPPSIADERFRALDELVADRFAALPLTALLVYVLDSVEPSALPVLAWQFKAIGAAWQAATTDAAKRAVIRRVLVRRRHRGTHWAVEDALDAVGFTALSWDGKTIVYNGEIAHNGMFDRTPKPWWMFWVVVVGEPSPTELATIQGIAKEWQRRSMRFEVFWVETAELLEEMVNYHAVS